MVEKKKVLFEGLKNGYQIGHTDNYIKVKINESSNYHNQIMDINLVENNGSHMIGHM